MRDAAGTDMLRIGQAMNDGRRLTPQDMNDFSRLDGQIDAPWAILRASTRLKSTPPAIRVAVEKADALYFGRVRPANHAILRRPGRRPSPPGRRPIRARRWRSARSRA